MDEQPKNSYPNPVEFVKDHDRKLEKQIKFEDRYVRQTFLIDKQLLQRMNAFFKEHPRFKTQWVNFALQHCLDQVMPPTEKQVQVGKRSGSDPVQLSRAEVIALLDEALNPKMLLSKEDIEKHLIEDLFSKNPDQTALEINGTGKYVSPKRKRKYYLTFNSAKECVLDLIKFYNDEKQKSDKERKRQEKERKKRLSTREAPLRPTAEEPTNGADPEPSTEPQ